MGRRHLARRMFCLVVALGLSGTRMVAPEAVAVAASGSIAGHVVDTAGQALPGVSVTTIPERGGLAKHTTSDGGGAYRFDELSDFTYRVDFELRGFDLTRRNHVRVRADERITVDAALSISSVCECVTVQISTALRPRTSVCGYTGSAEQRAVHSRLPLSWRSICAWGALIVLRVLVLHLAVVVVVPLGAAGAIQWKAQPERERKATVVDCGSMASQGEMNSCFAREAKRAQLEKRPFGDAIRANKNWSFILLV